MSRAGRSTFRLVYMGDSITFGQYVDPALRWTTLVAGRLAARFAADHVQFEHLIRGLSGETTRIGLERFPEAVQQAEPDVVILTYGLNDCNCWQTDGGLPRVSEAAFRANLVEMVTRARRFGAREVILTTNHRTLRRSPTTSGEVYEDANASYSQIVRGVASESGATLCDVRAGFENFSDSELQKLLLPAPDLLHLSPLGNRMFADLIWPHVEASVQALTAQPV